MWWLLSFACECCPFWLTKLTNDEITSVNQGVLIYVHIEPGNYTRPVRFRNNHTVETFNVLKSLTIFVCSVHRIIFSYQFESETVDLIGKQPHWWINGISIKWNNFNETNELLWKWFSLHYTFISSNFIKISLMLPYQYSRSIRPGDERVLKVEKLFQFIHILNIKDDQKEFYIFMLMEEWHKLNFVWCLFK